MLILLIGRTAMMDLLFWQQLARALSARANRVPTIVVHALGETADRVLESYGDEASVVARGATPAHAALVHRAAREESRRVSGLLTEEGIASVGLLGTDRGLLSFAADEVVAGGASFVGALAEGGTLPLVSSTVPMPGGAASVPAEWSALAIQSALLDAQPNGQPNAQPNAQIILVSPRSIPKTVSIDLNSSGKATGELQALTYLIERDVSVRVSGVSGVGISAEIPGIPILRAE